MEREILRKLKLAGQIAGRARNFGVRLLKNGIPAFEVAQKIDDRIIELGGKPAFPTCVSINDMAAHYSPVVNDSVIIKEGDYVKLDLGAHLDGWISDAAITVIVGRKKDNIIECSEKMLEKAIPMFKPGTKLGEIGEAIENVAREFKLNPIRNLTGHSIERYNLHAGRIVPNIRYDSKYELKEDEVYACEPFVTDGAGFVKESGSHQIFRYLREGPSRSQEARKIVELAKTEFARLPFAKRWVQQKLSVVRVELALKELVDMGALYGYSPLRETSGRNVAQTEHTIIVKEKPVVTTL